MLVSGSGTSGGLHDVIVDEEAIETQSKLVMAYATDLEQRYEQYLQVLKDLYNSEDGVYQSGAVHTALERFYGYAKELRGCFDAIAQDYNELGLAFKREVDAADDKIGY